MAKTTITKAPRVTLKSGLTVANFCGEEETIFTDGNVLHGCEQDRVLFFAPVESLQSGPGRKGTKDLYSVYGFNEPDLAKAELTAMEGDASIDVILVSPTVMEALKSWGWDFKASKARMRCFDKITQTIRTDYFGSVIKGRVVEPEFEG